jgi:hypothetical protein
MQRISGRYELMLLAALLAAALATLANPLALAQGRAAGQCGTERWSVKTLTDPAAAQVDLAPKPATVEQLAALPVPAGFGPDAARLQPEFQTYVVKATLGEFKEEADSDIHLVILGASGQSMIAEIPDPGCAQGSRVQTQISQARAWFVGRFGQPSRTSWHRVNAPLTVTGVLFFDVPHGQTGVAPNAVELHPVIGIGP